MVFLECLNIFPDATRFFILQLAEKEHPLAAAIIDFPLDPDQSSPPTLTEREEEYLNAAVALLRAQDLLSASAQAIAPPPRSPSIVTSPRPSPVQRAQPSVVASTYTAQASPRVAPAIARPAMSDAPTRLAPTRPTRVPSAGPGPSGYAPPQPTATATATAIASSAPLPQQQPPQLQAQILAQLQAQVHAQLQAQLQALRQAQRQQVQLTSQLQQPQRQPRLQPQLQQTQQPLPAPHQQEQRQVEDDTGVEDENEDSAHTYSSYAAKNVRDLFPTISAHPDPLVETASLASVQLPKLDPEIVADCEDLQDDIDEGRLSDAQLESIIYAWNKFSAPRLPDGKRRGFFLGDGAGVGKGRTIAGLVKKHWNASDGGKYILWLSVSQDLRRDARRDLDDIGASGISIYEPTARNPIPVGEFKGVVFITYSLLRSGLPSAGKRKKNGKKKTVPTNGGAARRRVVQLMAMAAAEGTSSGGSSAFGSEAGGDDDQEEEDDEDSLRFEIENLSATSRLAQVIAWLKRGGENGSLIVFDESHRAKNLLLVRTQTARAVVHLQEQLPDAKVLYSSATGASEPHNLAYMTRLWGAQETKGMVELLSNAKLGALELAAISLKSTGTYLARTLSYEDAEFHLEKVEISPHFELMYERSAYFWTLLYQVLCRVGNNNIKKWRGQFWGAHQRFYRSMLMASKVKKCAELCRDAVAEGMSVVIGLQSTGESVTQQLRGNVDSEEFDDLVSAPRQILETFIRNFFPVTNVDANSMDGGARSLESLEYQVWEAVKIWKDMPSIDELAAAAVPATAGGGGGGVGIGIDVAGGGAGFNAAAAAEAILTGATIDLARIITDEQLAEVASNGGYLARDIASRAAAAATHQRQRHSYSDILEGDFARAAKDLSDAKKYKQSLLYAIAAAEGRAPPPRRLPTTPTAAAAPAAASPLFIDLSGDTTDEEGDQKNINPAGSTGCMLCSNPADAAMATCLKCCSRVHSACLGLWKVPQNFTCDTCLIKGNVSGDGAAAAAPAVIKKEPEATTPAGTPAAAAAVHIKPEPSSSRAAPNDELTYKSLADLRMLLSTADHKIAVAEKRVKVVYDAKREAKLEQDAVDGKSKPFITPRRSKMAKKNAQDAAKIKAEQGHRSPVLHPRCVETTTPTDAIANYRSATERPRERLLELPDEFPTREGENRSLTRMRDWLLLLVQAGLDLPHNPIDKLIEECGGKSKVAELTGRRGFIELDQDKETARYTLRNDGDGPGKEINLREKDRFMNGSKRIAIISDAASTGISLQADKRVASRNFRRLHLTLELPWSADKAVQQFGRSHRANQQSAPVYKILVTPCGGEYRFASAAAKRLQSLGALLRGDRNAVGAGAELKAFDVDNQAGHIALQRMLRCITSEENVMPGVNIPELPDNLKLKYGIPIEDSDGEDQDGSGANARNRHPSQNPFNIHYCQRLYNLGLLERYSNNLSGYGVKNKSINDHFHNNKSKNSGVKLTQFLNRLLGLPIEEQDLLFKFFSDTLDATITNLKSLGKYDNGIMSLQGHSITKTNEEVVLNDPVSGAAVKHVTVRVVQSVTFAEAQAMIEEAKQRITELTGGTRTAHLSGFYVQRTQTFSLSGVRHPRIEIALEVADATSSTGRVNFIKMREIHPYGQDFVKVRQYQDLQETKWKLLRDLDEAKIIWDAWYSYTATGCLHGEGCTKPGCKLGCRHTDKHLLCGSVLSYWDRLEKLHMHAPFARRFRRTYYTYENNESYKRVIETPDPLYVGRAITKHPSDPDQSGEPIVGILAENEEEIQYLKHHLVPRTDDPTYQDPLITSLGTNYTNQNAVRGLVAGSDPFIRRENGSAGGAGGSGNQSKRPKNFR